ncbi:MAG: heavy metal translocating P-type ATPase, partial [Clostridium sp.]
IIGEVAAIYPGEVVPVDGQVISGESFIDESMLTGESELIKKSKGDMVSAGTLNGTGNFKVKITKYPKDTVLASIVRLVEEAQISKPNIQKITDKISRIFVPAVLIISLAVFCFWYFYVYNSSSFYIEKSILLSVSILVVSCPCALGIAIPMAVSLGMGVSASKGILIKNIQALQDIIKADTIVFDKTGTLTNGICSVNEIIRLNKESKYTDDELSILAGSLEQKSEHHLGKAICRYSMDKGLNLMEPDKFKAIVGKGVIGTVSGKKIKIGNNKLIKISEKCFKQLEDDEFINVYIEIDNKLEAMFKINNEIKKGADYTIQNLKDRGIHVIMLTGDNAKISENIGQNLGIEEIYSEMMPEDKVHIINKLKDEGRFVVMVGDGINDAPALAAANVSIAIGSGTDAAIQSSDIVILGNDLKQIIRTMNLSESTIKKIRSNLFLAIIYNIIAIPIAAFGKLTPETASTAMALSSISVVLNSLGIKRKYS